MAGTVDPRISRILSKLEVLRGKGVETFGADKHGFTLAPPLSEAAVIAYETKHGITLPAEYRVFLLQAGASGAGPYYGLNHPDRWDDALEGDVAMPDFAARACIWTADTPRTDEIWEAKRAEHSEPFAGAIAIADQGCAYYVTLVTAGPERGRIMYVSMDGAVPFFPANPDFLSWYERWLDELLAGFNHFWFGTQIPGDEASFAALARSADDPRRHDALGAMFQLPSLGPDAREAVALRIRDTDPKIRTTALRLARDKGVGPEIELHLRRALTDDTPDVRTSALEALAEAPLKWHRAARTALADTIDSVATSAARLLHDAKALAETDLIALIHRPGTRRAALDLVRTMQSLAIYDALIEAGPDAPEERKQGEPYIAALNAHAAKRILDAPRRERLLAMLTRRLAEVGTGKLPFPIIVGFRTLAAEEPAALATLIGLLKHPEGYNRFDAANQLGELGDAEALPALRELTSDATMPCSEHMSTAWSVGVAAGKAIAKIEASLARRS